jgi:nitrogen-specific signal transduction histidine kinase/CheY-like chemotaxis protein
MAGVAIRDVTETRASEIATLQLAKVDAIGLFAAGLGHEIKNRLTVLHAIVTLLPSVFREVETRLSPEDREVLKGQLTDGFEYLEDARLAVASLIEIARDLGSFQGNTNGPGDIANAMAASLTMLRNDLRGAVTIEQDLTTLRPVGISTARLGQVLLNLIQNATQAFVERNADQNRIRLRTRDDEGFVLIEVEDNGPGIPIGDAAKIFEPFFTTKAHGQGSGLGLSISRQILRTAGGDIQLAPASGGGALFRVSLPAFSEKPAVPQAALQTPRVYPRRRILTVDDETIILNAYRRMFRTYHDIVTISSGRDALVVLGTDTKFDLILCDLMMPDMSGAEFFQAVRDLHPGLKDRFIFVTGGAFTQGAREFLERVAMPTVEKPFRVEDVLDLVENRVQAALSGVGS